MGVPVKCLSGELLTEKSTQGLGFVLSFMVLVRISGLVAQRWITAVWPVEKWDTIAIIFNYFFAPVLPCSVQL